MTEWKEKKNVNKIKNINKIKLKNKEKGKSWYDIIRQGISKDNI